MHKYRGPCTSCCGLRKARRECGHDPREKVNVAISSELLARAAGAGRLAVLAVLEECIAGRGNAGRDRAQRSSSARVQPRDRGQ